MSRTIYHLKITLADVRPRVWRRVAVPGGYTLDRVHRVIQLAVGWQDCHLHSFDISAAQYGPPDPGGLEVRDEMDLRLDSVAEAGSGFTYTYDFGDWWEHEVLVEDVVIADPEVWYPRCLAGAGQCPPEDVGGAYGYERYRAAIADPDHKDHDAIVEWFGAPTKDSGFDIERASVLMRRMT